MTEQQVILKRQEKEQAEKVKASVPDKKKLAEMEKNVEHLKKGRQQHRNTFSFCFVNFC